MVRSAEELWGSEKFIEQNWVEMFLLKIIKVW